MNRTATRVELTFDVVASPSLTRKQRQLILSRLHGQIDSSGVLHLFSQATSSQWRNRQDAVARFRILMRQSLRVRRNRVRTRPTGASREKRLREKRRRSLSKGLRRRVAPES